MKRERLDNLICLGLRIFPYSGDRRPVVESYDLGWAYSVGLPGDALMINIFTEGKRLGPRRLRKSFEFLLGEISKCPASGSRVMASRPAKYDDVRPFVADASSTRTRPAAGLGWACAGDHVQSMDPLSSSGIVHAVEHATRLSEALLACGNPGEAELTDYGASLEASYRTYLSERGDIYRMERRWRNPFWDMRQLATAS